MRGLRGGQFGGVDEDDGDFDFDGVGLGVECFLGGMVLIEATFWM